MAQRLPVVATDELFLSLKAHKRLMYLDEVRAVEKMARIGIGRLGDGKEPRKGKRSGSPVAGADERFGAIAATARVFCDGVGDFDFAIEFTEPDVPKQAIGGLVLDCKHVWPL